MAYGTIDPEKCERMLARIHPRGPAETGRVHLEHAWLGHQRLSIMDVTGGKQPIADDTDSAYVVGNGEIYNHEDIRDVLSEVRFATAVPVEVRPARLAPDKQWTEEDLGHIRDVLSDSIRRHMMSDVPVGVFLSGGLDSAIVAAIGAKVADEGGERLPTFAVGTEGSADLLAARAVAEHLGTDHHEIVPSPNDLESALDEAGK